MNTKKSTIETAWIRHALQNLFVRDESGQTLPFVALFMTAMLGFTGFVVDAGHAYVVQEQIQNSANSAALAGAGFVFTSKNAPVNSTTQASQFSATGTINANSYVTNPPLIQQVCVNMLMPSGTTCNSTSVANAVRVTQTAQVNTWFMGLFGFHTLTTSATAMATMIGGQAQPWNIAIILDATPSMLAQDANCGSGMTEFTCATTAIQAMLGAASPCQPGVTSCSASNANMRVSLFSFPGVSTDTVANDSTNCGTAPNYMLYTLPPVNATSYSPATYTENGTSWSATYQIVPFSSDYYKANSPGNLNPSSPLVSALTGCMNAASQQSSVTGAMQLPPSSPANSGLTYFAPPMYAAQAALLAAKAANPKSQNALILLSDGQANLVAGSGSYGENFPSLQNATLPNGSKWFTTAGVNGAGIYPDLTDECQQAIVAAQQAAKAGTRVYSVSYGAETDGCSSTTGSSGTTWSYGTDNTNVATGQNAAFSATTINPCITMQNIASSMNYFYSDHDQSNAGTGPSQNCIDNAHQVTSLKDILLSVVSDFLLPRLLPTNASYVVVPSA